MRVLEVKKRPERDYVWCDVHGEIHTRHEDRYHEGQHDCRPDNWRAVFIETMSANARHRKNRYIKERAITILERIGFKRNGDTEEWLLQDTETSSFFSVEFKHFEQYGDRGIWQVSPWASIMSRTGGPLAETELPRSKHEDVRRDR